MDMLAEFDLSPLFISLKTGVAAAFLCFFLGVFAAIKVVKLKGKKKAVLDAIFTLPMIFPPTVAGFVLLFIFSRRRPVGMFLYDVFGISVVQTFLGCVIAATVVAFPLMYKNAKAAFEAVDPDIIHAARTLGFSEVAIFWRIIVPVSMPGLISGVILSFARAIGEYGATSMLAGNISGKTGTISQKIAMVMQDGDYGTAGVWSLIITVIALVIIIVTNMLPKSYINSKG